MPKKIVVFADGTGNAFSVLETNVWRLYQALDRTQPDQISYYIKGVGTSGFRVLALLDGATGLGVPSNVRRLYRFISLNWEPGDEIYMFGFSRGAFTIRTLIGLMHDEGLIPTLIDNEPVSRGETHRNTAGAWRSYRSKTISWKTRLPTMWLTRLARDAVIGIWRRIRGYRSYASIAEQTREQDRHAVPIKFVGLFDTVEAYGVPLEEFRHAIDTVIWPISFTNAILSEHVERACHALSLDDERTTFHPLCIDRQRSVKPERIKEVWFAGVHSDIGGGYPEDDLAHVPLAWMKDQLGESLRFATELFAENASPYAAAHDSRAGLGFFYRYGPRTIADNGGPPVIHHSVAEKMAFGIERYTPVTLPVTAHVLLPDGNTHQIKGFDHSKSVWRSVPDEKLKGKMELAEKAVGYLNNPDPTVVSLTLDNIWRRRGAYFLLLIVAFLVALWPWTVSLFVAGFRDVTRFLADWVGSAARWDMLWYWSLSIDQGTSSYLENFFRYLIVNLRAVAPLINTIASGIWKVVASPEYAEVWSNTLLDWPATFAVLISLAILLYAKYARLRDDIADLAYKAWRPSATKSKELKPRPRTFANMMRRSRVIAFAKSVVGRYALPFGALIVILALICSVISHSMINFRDANGDLCSNYLSGRLLDLEPNVAFTREGFTIDQLCWPTGVRLEKGRNYTLWIEMTDPPFFDQTVMADIAGFRDSSLPYLLALPFRRWWGADWFQPIARIGRYGFDTWPLVSADGDTAIPTGQDAAGNPMPKRFYEFFGKLDTYGKIEDDSDNYAPRLEQLKQRSNGDAVKDPSRLAVSEKIPEAELPAAIKIRKKFALRNTYVSNFTARSDGELFLYVNDAIAAIPFLKSYRGFYDNNTGKAKITIKQVVSPRPFTGG